MRTPRSRTASAAVLALGLLAATACSTSGGSEGAATTAASPPETAATSPGSVVTVTPETTETTEVAEPTETTEGSPGEAGEPTFEEVAVAFVRAAFTGGDASPYVADDLVAAAAEAAWAEQGVPVEAVEIEPTYVDPLAQGGVPGQCQLIGDVTVTCAVMVTYPAPADGPASSVLYAVLVTDLPPGSEAPGPDRVTPYVVGFEALAG